MRGLHPAWAAVVAASSLLAFGCRRQAERSSLAPPKDQMQADNPAPLRFRAQELPFTYGRRESGAAWPVESTDGGGGLLDVDGDGRLDLFSVQGGPCFPG